MKAIYILWAILLCIEIPLIIFADYQPNVFNLVLRNLVLAIFLVSSK